MFYETDWLLRQISMLTSVIARFVLGRDAADSGINYVLETEDTSSDNDRLYLELLDLLTNRRFCEAEDRLFDAFVPGNTPHIRIAVEFYERMNGYPDEELEENNFSREEIREGLKEIMRLSGMSVLADIEI